MKFMGALALWSVMCFSVNALAVDFGLECTMSSVKDANNKVSAKIDKLDANGYGLDYSESIDDLYNLMLEATDIISKNKGTLNILIADENDEVGSFLCDLANKKSKKIICTEPIESEAGVHTYDIECKFI